ncbi:unnamed protein product [Bemisia tabaci]|uniref:Cornichon n=1 Tax=Bemisia tabaci TaxID=7038 RepID=A0A9P0F104_BEMTA|nr:PREDICTED: protein cornichon homolog 4 [Bemisia tabaci]CAH0387370.1 unnamed protein product [Bemisia tabaci]
MSETLLFLFSLIDTGAILFLLVYFVITLSDLESDYLNAQQCCAQLNIWVIPKLAAHVVIFVLFILFQCWWLALANIPVLAWISYEFYSVPPGNTGVYDPTEIHNHGQLRKYMRDCLISIGWYLIAFFCYLYCLILSLIKDNPLEKDGLPSDH